MLDYVDYNIEVDHHQGNGNGYDHLDGDCNLAALGEKWLGVARGVNNFVCLTLGTGVGGALFLNGRIYHGATGAAGHIGHYLINPDGPECGCGG